MDNINWLEEVTKRKEDLFKDLFRLLEIESVRNDDLATEEQPVGPGPLNALKEFMTMGEEDGFETQQFGPWAGRIEVGQGDEILGILGHVDVVPAGSGWESDPFTPIIKEDRIYARGACDDKGPTVGAYFAIKLLRELGVEFNKKIHLIIGTDEESGWQCMDYYFKHAEMPDFGFSPDADFPIINGEKGNVSAIFSGKVQEKIDGMFHLVRFESGLRANMVPESASVEITTDEAFSTIEEAFNSYLSDNQLKGEITQDEESITIKLVGKSAHGSTPEKGINGATFLAQFLNNYSFDNQLSQEFIQLLSQELHLGFNGEKIGVACRHEVMGEVSMNIGIANYSENKGIHIDANFRFPEGTTPEIMQGQIFEVIKKYPAIHLTMSHAKQPHYVPANDPLVQTLLDVYHRQTGLPAYEQTIGGGTYGRLMPRGVAFGALFPDSIDTMHQANEFLAVEDLLRATAIYAESIYLLTR